MTSAKYVVFKLCDSPINGFPVILSLKSKVQEMVNYMCGSSDNVGKVTVKKVKKWKGWRMSL